MKINPDLIRDYVYPIGSTIITDTNVNPSSRLGGEGTLTKKEFITTKSLEIQNTDAFSPNTTNMQLANSRIGIDRVGNSIFIQIYIYPNVNLTTSTTLFGTINPQKVGVNLFQHTEKIGASSDGGNAIGLVNFRNNGEVQFLRTISKTSEGKLAKGTKLSGFIPIPCCPPETMIDSFCDKFFWERIA